MFKKTFSFDEIKRNPIIVDDVSSQDVNESRRVWHNVTVEILKGDFENADIQKKNY